ncbi:hypothetical protein SAMN05216431_1243, partial [Ligilactobacillus sp. WC1T17]
MEFAWESIDVAACTKMLLLVKLIISS